MDARKYALAVEDILAQHHCSLLKGIDAVDNLLVDAILTVDILT